MIFQGLTAAIFGVAVSLITRWGAARGEASDHMGARNPSACVIFAVILAVCYHTRNFTLHTGFCVGLQVMATPQTIPCIITCLSSICSMVELDGSVAVVQVP